MKKEQSALIRGLYRITNAIKMGWWAYKHPKLIQEHNFNILSELLETMLKVARENRPMMANIAMVHLEEEPETVVSIWVGAGVGATPNKRIAELLDENKILKEQLFKLTNKETN